MVPKQAKFSTHKKLLQACLVEQNQVASIITTTASVLYIYDKADGSKHLQTNSIIQPLFKTRKIGYLKIKVLIANGQV